MKIERGETYLTFEENDLAAGVAEEHLGRWRLARDGGCESCAFFKARTACAKAGCECLPVGLHYVRD